jgi:hypothetical protein
MALWCFGSGQFKLPQMIQTRGKIGCSMGGSQSLASVCVALLDWPWIASTLKEILSSLST